MKMKGKKNIREREETWITLASIVSFIGALLVLLQGIIDLVLVIQIEWLMPLGGGLSLLGLIALMWIAYKRNHRRYENDNKIVLKNKQF